VTWTPELDAAILNLHAIGLPLSNIVSATGMTRGAIAGRLSRLGAPGYKKPSRIRYRSDEKSRRKYTTIERGDWDAKTFEPYEVRKQRLAAERMRDHNAEA